MAGLLLSGCAALETAGWPALNIEATLMAQVAADWQDAPCTPPVGPLRAGTVPDAAISDRLAALAAADQADRSAGLPLATLAAADRDRRAAVLALMQAGQLVTGADFYHAGLIFQHGDCPAHFWLAVALAEQAIARGDPNGKALYAVAVDRALSAVGQRQRFGTQYYVFAGQWVLYPVEPATTDAERADYGVLSLAGALRRAAALNRHRPPAP
jgi:hypothetical protein